MLQNWLTLYYTPKIGARRFQQLLNYFGSIEKILEADQLAWQEAGIPSSVKHPSHYQLAPKIEAALSWAEEPNHAILHLESESYPPLLKEIFDPPAILFVKGSIPLLSAPQIAIVGTRKPTQEGSYNAKLFASELTAAGLTVTSGLALGIDYIAHKAAVEHQAPTVAVLGTGLNEIYPKNHLPLSEAIIEYGGTIISEYPLHMPAKPQNFPRRNRIIAGLSLGTLVVEAAQKSGSLITARMSMEENRDLFTIPGSIHSPQSRGCHQLIREGATLVESTHDIRSLLKGWIDPAPDSPQTSLNLIIEEETPNEKAKNSRFRPKSEKRTARTAVPLIPADHPQYELYQLLMTPKSINQLVEQLNKSAADITTDLMMLEIEGVITSDQGIYQQKRD